MSGAATTTLFLARGPYKPKYVNCEVLHIVACAVLGTMALPEETEVALAAMMLKYHLGREQRFERITDPEDFELMGHIAEIFCAECPHVHGRIRRPLVHTASVDLQDPLVAAGLVDPLPRHVFLKERGRLLLRKAWSKLRHRH